MWQKGICSNAIAVVIGILLYAVVLILGILTGTFPEKFWKRNARIDPATFPIPPSLLRDDAEGFIVLSILLHPFSKGNIELRSANYMHAPVIHPGYLLDERDVETLAAGAVEAVRVTHGMGYKDIVMAKDLSHLDVVSMDYWRAVVRRYASTLYHPCGTCAMGKVVDSRLRVLGVRKLRVADASVFPHLTSGNTNAPAIMVGEMAADIIKQDYGL